MTERGTPAAPPVAPGQGWPPEQGSWTYEDWLKLPDDGYRYEVLDGVLYMSRPPRSRHQLASANLYLALSNYARARHLGRLYYAPIGVRLPNQPVPVQPDIQFISTGRIGIVSEDYVEGAPDLVIEILSPSHWLYNRREKFEAYEQAGVREYWLVDYRAKTIEVFVLTEGAFVLLGKWGEQETVRSEVLKGFEIAVADVFAE
jgi:Uma2 family endonuclease